MKTANNIQGFTLFDLLVAMSLAGILMSIALLDVNTVNVNFNRADARNRIRRDLRLAQLQSVSEGGRGLLVLSSDGRSYTFGYDYLSYDTTAPIVYDSFMWNQTLPDYTKISLNKQIIFDSKGRVIDKDGVINDVTVSFYDTSSGTDVLYATATLSSVGVLTFN